MFGGFKKLRFDESNILQRYSTAFMWKNSKAFLIRLLVALRERERERGDFAAHDKI